MKSFTDIEQSRKLAEILSLESADMCYCNDGTAIKIDATSYSVGVTMWKSYLAELIPCWSLAALIEVMPDSVTDEDGVSYGLNICKDFVEYYNSSLGALCASYHSVNAVTTVDACYEMIVKLKEENLI